MIELKQSKSPKSENMFKFTSNTISKNPFIHKLT